MILAVSMVLFLGPKEIYQIQVFGLYLLFILIFAVIYNALYRSRRSHFIFNADVLSHQKRSFKDELETLSVLSASHTQLLNDALSHVRKSGINDLGEGDRVVLDFNSGRIVFVRTILPATEPPEPYLPPDSMCSLVLYSAKREKVGQWSIENWADSGPSDVIQDTLDRIRKKKLLIDKRLETFATEYPDVWSFWDFLYFSTITQTTVGYGDILPNSTVVRQCVSIQVILGYVLLAVVINLLVFHSS